MRARRRTGARAGEPDLTASGSGRHRPGLRALTLAAVTLLGAWLGLVIIGTADARVGPMDTRMSLHPSFTGGTTIDVPPLGALTLDSHHAPLRLQVDVSRLDPVRAQTLVKHPQQLQFLARDVSHDASRAVGRLAVRSAVAVVLGATAAGLVVYRRPRRALAAGGLALAVFLASGAGAWATWRPGSVLEPKFSGLLSGAPSLVGNARSIVGNFHVYGQELARLVSNMTKLYAVTSTLPAYTPDPSTIRVLHVSDIHLNPAAWQIITSVIHEYRIDMVIDTGDLMDHGTAAENGFTASIQGLKVPYVYVRGNHDSLTSQRSVASRKGAYVVDSGHPVVVDGLRVAGVGDPQFTPDRSISAAGDPSERRAGAALAEEIRRLEASGQRVDLAIAHNPIAAAQTDGTVALALAGHTHRRDVSVLPHGTRLMVEGTTGGGGLRAVEGATPQPVEASVLYLDRATHRLQAWDEITLGGLGLSTAEVSRRLPAQAAPAGPPSPSGSSPQGTP